MKKVKYPSSSLIALLFYIVLAVYFIFMPMVFPLNGTTWEYCDQYYRHTLSFKIITVTFTIYNIDGSVYQDPDNRSYSLKGNVLTEVKNDEHGERPLEYVYNGSAIIATKDTTIMYTPKRMDK